MTFEEVKEIFKKSIDATDTMNQALENFIQSIYLKGYGDAISKIEKLPVITTLDEAIIHAEEVAEECDMECKIIYPNSKSKCANEHRRLAEWLKELKQLREQTQWIPTSKRLPKKSGKYWCTFGGTNLTGSDYYTSESDAKELFDDSEKYAGWQSQNVVAWMPLPEPFREEDKDEN